ncbi:MAG: 4-(cytidine 5'-diphospho)-2-C-methyl-D-erythritol kinase [Planctomycetes bacterium]|nr:4-(cytidine 5'-diphospho)-2-C-methyl-D-erythritol kinase [Planctomycetota bacterium]
MGSLCLGCKVNWSLRVLGRREDGFHELRSWFVRLDGGDRLAWQEGSTGLNLAGSDGEGVPQDSSNLVLRADAAWRAAGGVAPTWAWTLEKRLPPGSGLGAGSADAAGVLRVLEATSSRPLGRDRCLELALELGSDVPFFLMDAPAVLLGGRGERVLAEAEPQLESIVVVLPQVHASTPQVFAALGAPEFHPAPEPAGSERFPPQPSGNELEAAALQANPALAAVRTQLHGFAPFQLSGSGAAWFHPCTDEEAASLLHQLHIAGYRAQLHRVLREPQEVQA